MDSELGYDRAATSGPRHAADESGSTYIMVAIEGLSRFVVLEPASDASGESVARFLRKLVAPVGWFGRPKGIGTGRTDGPVTVGRSMTIISSMFQVSATYWALSVNESRVGATCYSGQLV